MPSFTRRLRRSRAGRRVSVASLIAIFAISLFATVPVAAVPAVPGPGYQDFQYNPGPDSAPGGDAVTGARNQSKIWFHDGKWWGILFDKTDAADAVYRIQSMSMATQTWTTGGSAPQVDRRNRSHADALADGNTLWVASSHFSGTNMGTNGNLRVYRFNYNTGTHAYVQADLDPDTTSLFRVVATGGTSAATIAKAPNGILYVAYTQRDSVTPTTSHVKVVSSTTSAGTAWNAPEQLVGGTLEPLDDDIAAVTNINGGIGVFWSNQSDDAFYFQPRLDAGGWGARQTAYSAVDGADGHISVKTAANGDVLAAVKTGQAGSNPLIGVLRRTAAGAWQSLKTVATSSGDPDPTRPILVLDEENSQADVFMTSQVDGGFITRRTASLTTLDFGAPSAGTAFIQSAADPAISDATSSKQAATVASGLIVLASDRTSTIRRYLHGCAGSACPEVPVAAFSGTPLTGDGPLNVQFTDASTGVPATWAWTFGDGGTSPLQNPSHTFNAGTWTVSLTVTNAAGTDVETKTGYVVVSVPPGATYTAINPFRILNTRNGTGVTGKFVNGVPKTFQVSGVGVIPANAIGITGNLTVADQTARGFVFLGPDPVASPTSSTINFPVGDTRANGVTVDLNGTGKLSATYIAPTAGANTNLFLDVTGYFVEGPGGPGDATYTAINPFRVLNTRNGTGLSNKFVNHVPRNFPVAGVGLVPANAVAITGNLTVADQSARGFVFLGPTSSANPTSSTINFPTGDTRANGVTVDLSDTGRLSATYVAPNAGATTNLLLDITGYFVDDDLGAKWFPLSPTRILNTRNGTGLTGKFVNHGPRSWTVVSTGGISATAVAITGNLTVADQSARGFVFLAPTTSANPTSSTINFPVGDTRANGVTVALSLDGKLSATYVAPNAGATTNLLLDVTGYFE